RGADLEAAPSGTAEWLVAPSISSIPVPASPRPMPTHSTPASTASRSARCCAKSSRKGCWAASRWYRRSAPKARCCCISSPLPIISVDPLQMFPETLEYRDTLTARLGLVNSSVVQPDPTVLAAKDEAGLRWSWDPDGCCEIRKVEPLKRAKQGLDAWISGRKA